VVAGDITTLPKQGKRAVPISSLSILLCLYPIPNEKKTKETMALVPPFESK